MSFKRSSVVILCLLLSKVVNAEVNTLPAKKTKLEIKPMVCMVKSMGQICEMTVSVDWAIQAPENVCLFKNNTSLQCWKDKRKAKANINISISEDMIFSLKNEKMHVLATQKVKINAAANRKYRRKLKSDWSFF
ncbi:DUF3019 domain-containing protein [Pseudoalteromonas luteoviolacea]|uniref:DUF3019 domain-containing protein n=1 Tax=Pseudoalteromonas luteoviolacea S4054 TaxID=1129367 RepID=A0A0F6A942_9GAMM|nr:DUF3019 domain-containing protein [Pseudoalteromonas luteoviolacea]AOT11004.1 hypothetical protein S4054249_24510 [Pseudoalteromonas luteoviolacea]AOT15832.1 hypothetical protein S40542_24000 [Pseudoalteromonas luteoviolacea]AOT20825.1 hypothetical protein S4054_24430 [Pseudoalteromonas luteoviolacea]KKE81904.1 hypothetical protein N479_20945 [Pseudoalteromonas luteoviolacea S4054]KZN72235.1 hypothetical protein N481_16240 [Pseudoalteromonas luteoviolacea S4047-1]